MDFPYIKQIVVNDCHAYQGIKIPKQELQTLKHIVITGRNGTGKTTILNRIDNTITTLQKNHTKDQIISSLKGLIAGNPYHQSIPEWERQKKELEDIDLIYFTDLLQLKKRDQYIYSFFLAHRKVQLNDVSTVIQEEKFIKEIELLPASALIAQFKQFIVNKKVAEAFDFMNGKSDKLSNNKKFFETLLLILQTIFHDEKLELEFIQDRFEFNVTFGTGRKVTFNQLSEGFSAFLNIIVDLLMRTDLLRKQRSDYDFNSPGIVIIDEPETHLHISMQYEIFPLLTELFPNIQFIIATHSPAIISSVKNAVVYDLTSSREISDSILGSSFSELMITHFGLDNEFSPIADEIIENAKEAFKTNDKEKLFKILKDQDKILTPTLKLEIESQLLYLQSRKQV